MLDAGIVVSHVKDLDGLTLKIATTATIMRFQSSAQSGVSITCEITPNAPTVIYSFQPFNSAKSTASIT